MCNWHSSIGIIFKYWTAFLNRRTKYCFWHNTFVSVFLPLAMILFQLCSLGALLLPSSPLRLTNLAFLPVMYQPGGLLLSESQKQPALITFHVSVKAFRICTLIQGWDAMFRFWVYNHSLAMTRKCFSSCLRGMWS